MSVLSAPSWLSWRCERFGVPPVRAEEVLGALKAYRAPARSRLVHR